MDYGEYAGPPGIDLCAFSIACLISNRFARSAAVTEAEPGQSLLVMELTSTGVPGRRQRAQHHRAIAGYKPV